MGYQQDFINKVKDGAIRGWKNHQILPSLTIAQGILESDWGRSGLATKGNNLFGVKGDYKGQSVTMQTSEYIDGKWIKVDAQFAKYPDWNTSVEEHGAFFSSTDWRKDNYKHVFGETNYKDAVNAILPPKAGAGYATDPGYASKITNIIEQNNLTRFDKEAGVKPEATPKVVGVFVIDPGHGGSDPGAQANGLIEKVWNLDVAKRVESKLKSAGHTVHMTRTNDKSVSLSARSNQSNNIKPDAFLSVHFNAGKLICQNV